MNVQNLAHRLDGAQLIDVREREASAGAGYSLVTDDGGEGTVA